MIFANLSFFFCHKSSLFPVELDNFTKLFLKLLLIRVVGLILFKVPAFVILFVQIYLFFIFEFELLISQDLQIVFFPNNILNVVLSPLQFELLNLSFQLFDNSFLLRNLIQNGLGQGIGKRMVLQRLFVFPVVDLFLNFVNLEL